MTTFTYFSSLDAAHDSLVAQAFGEWAWYAVDIEAVETPYPFDADVIFGWSDFADAHGIGYTSPSPFTTLVAFDPQATDNFYEVALHEIGHVLGLDHYDGADAVMNSSGGSDTGHLTDADIEHIQELYPYEWSYGWHLEPDWEYGWYWDDFSYWWYVDNAWQSTGWWWSGWWWCTGGWWYGWHEVPAWDYGWY